MPIVNVTVQVLAVTADAITLQVGPETNTIPRDQFLEWMNGTEHDLRHAFRNAAIGLKLDNVPLSDLAAVNAWLAVHPLKV